MIYALPMRILLVVVLVVASKLAHAETPAQVADKLVTAQLAALVANDVEALGKSFTSDAVILGPNSSSSLAKEGLEVFRVGIVGHTMHGRMFSAKQTSLVAGGDDKQVWIALEIATVFGGHEYAAAKPDSKATLRITELAVPVNGSWKIVAALVAEPGRESSRPWAVLNATKPDALSKLLASPSAISSGLAKDAVVLGTEKSERTVGSAAAKKLVESWKGLQLSIVGNVREVRTATYGFVQANLEWTDAKKRKHEMRGLVIATPDPAGTWTIRAVHYGWP